MLIIGLQLIKWFQVLLSNANDSIWYKTIVCTQWSGFKFSNLNLEIL